MAQHDGFVVHALGARGAHIVEGDVGRNLRTAQTDDVRHRYRAKHHGRHQQIKESWIRSGGDRQQMPLHTEEVLAEEAGDEGRHGDEQQGEDQDDGIAPLALLQAGDHTEDHAENRFEHEGHQGELDGHGEGAADHVDDKLSGEGLAEVEGQRVLQEQQILDDERLVQIVFGTDLGRDRFVDRLVAEHRLDRFARQREHQAYTRSVVPRTTGIICRMRRRRYLPIGFSF